MSKQKNAASKKRVARPKKASKGTGFIVMSQCTALVPYKGSPSLVLLITALQYNVSSLENTVRVKIDEIQFIKSDVPRVTQNLAPEFAHKITDINILYEEIERLEKGDLTLPDREDCTFRQDTDEEIADRTIQSNEEDLAEQQRMKKKPKNVRNLFRKITAYAHPTRDSDPNLQEFYMEAKTNYERNDLKGLRLLHKFLMKYLWARRIPSELALFLARKKAGLQKLIDEIDLNRVTLQKDPRVAIVLAFRSGHRNKAIVLYKEILEKNEVELTSRRNYLLSMCGLNPDRSPQAPREVVSTATLPRNLLG